MKGKYLYQSVCITPKGGKPFHMPTHHWFDNTYRLNFMERVKEWLSKLV